MYDTSRGSVYMVAAHASHSFLTPMTNVSSPEQHLVDDSGPNQNRATVESVAGEAGGVKRAREAGGRPGKDKGIHVQICN